MKKYFVTGLVILLPVAFTIAVVAFFVSFLTNPFLEFVQAIFTRYQLFNHGFLSGPQVQKIIAQILILIVIFSFTLLLGVIARWVFFHYLLLFGEYLVHRIPFISSIYKTSQDIINTLFASKAQSFKQVVVIQMFNGSQCIGFVTGENVIGLTSESLVAVFVPTTPNPTSGFLIMAKKENLIFLDMKVEEALKYVISCGVIVPNFKCLTDTTENDLKNPT